MSALKTEEIPTKPYMDLDEELKKANNELKSLLEEQKEFLDLGIKQEDIPRHLVTEIDKVGLKIKEIEKKMEDLKAEGKAFTLGQDTTEYETLERQLQYEIQARDAAIRHYEAIENINDAYARLGYSLGELKQRVINTMLSSLRKMGSVIQKSAIAPFKLLQAAAQRAFSRITKGSKSSNNIFEKGFKSILKYGLGIRSFYVLINRLRTAVKEGFSNLYNDTNMAAFKSQVDSLKASLLTLKNSFAAAFRPIVEIAIPYIQQLIDYMTRLLNMVGQFMAAITGQKNYTKAIKQTTAAIDAQNKAQNRQLSGLDKLNNLTSGSGGGGGGASTGGMFEEAPVDERWQNIAAWLKDMWDKSDFTELGRKLGEKLKQALDSIPWEEIKEKARQLGESLATLINGFIDVEGLGCSIGNTLAQSINTAFEFLNSFVHTLDWSGIGTFIAETLNGFFENIDWDLIKDTFVTGAEGLGQAINSFAKHLNWDAVATSISNAVNTFIDTVYAFIDTVDWTALGEKVGTTLSNAWTGIDWAKAGETLGEYFIAFFDFIGTAIENIDWWQVGESVRDFLVNIDWAGVAESFFEAVGAAIGGLAAFIGGLIGDGVEDAKQYFQDKIEEAGGNVVEGILVGIAEALVNIGKWINEHIFQPFIEGFKKAFGINSPSTVMKEQGTYIIQGLLDGITSLVDDVTEIWNKMKEKALEIWETVKTSLTEKWETTKQNATDKWNEIKENLNTTWETMKTTAETDFTAIKDYIQDKWNETEENTDGTWGRIKQTVSSIAADVKSSISSRFTEILASFGIFSSNAQSNWSNTWENIKSKLGSILGSIKDAVSNAFDWISNKISSIGSAISGAFSSANSATSAYSISAPYGTQVAALSNMDFPAYATGQVIPVSMKKHLAWLGDNNRETEVVSPLSTIEKAVENVALRMGGMNKGKITLEIPINLDGRQITKVVEEYDLQAFETRGMGLFEH